MLENDKCSILVEAGPKLANAFLKTLEEPLDNVTFILLTTHVKQLIPTILSRCQSLYISQHEQVPTHLILLGAQAEQIKGVSFSDFHHNQ